MAAMTGHSNGDCVEVADLNWRKPGPSTHNGACVEVAACACTRCGILVRDSRLAAASPVLTFSAEAWKGFLAGLGR